MPLQEVRSRMTTGLSELLNENFQYLEGMAQEAEQLSRDAVLYLHGEGKEAGCGLTAGAGLWVGIGDAGELNAYWVNGERHVLDANPLTAPIPAGVTSYIYLAWDDETQLPVPVVRQIKILPSPVGEAYLGEADADDAQCSSVDISEAESIDVSSVLLTIQTMQGWIVKAQAAIGDEYFGTEAPAKSLYTMVMEIYAGGGIGGDQVLWEALQKSLTSQQTIPEFVSEEIQTQLVDHIQQFHNGDGGNVVIPDEWWDFDSVNSSMQLLTAGRWLPDLPATQRNCITIIWGVWGDGSNNSPDFVDRVKSTLWNDEE